MTSSWWQTLVFAAASSSLPFLAAGAAGQKVSWITFAFAVAFGVVTGVANIFRSPLQNPPTMIKPKDTP